MNWFTADFHLSHQNIIRYCNRPFENVKQMNETILINLEESLLQGDILYYLGDLTFKEAVAKDFFKRFNKFEIHYIIGNHDNSKVLKIAKNYCKSVSNLKDVEIEGISITLCHYAMRVWNKSHFNAWQLFGHSHATLSPIGKQYDIGVDNNSFKPVSFEQLEIIMAKLPDNIDFIPPENIKSNQSFNS
jgi:calcineurin-like phosphoesterase family protein